MTQNDKQHFDWQRLVENSFLSLYQDNSNNDSEKCGYDYVFRFKQANVYVLIQNEVFETKTPDIKKSLIRKKYHKVVNQLTKRHYKLQNKYQNELHIGKQPTRRLRQKDNCPTNYYIGLTSLAVSYQDKTYPIDYKLGSEFFREDFVLDLDNKDKTIQIFNASSMLSLLQELQTPIDFIGFINYYQSALMNFVEFEHEIELVNKYLQEGLFLDDVRNVEQQLVDAGFLEEINQKKAIAIDKRSQKQQKAHQKLLDGMQEYSRVWVKLLIKINQQLRGELGRKLLVKLDEQSMYTRMKIVAEVMDFVQQPIELQQQGYIRHQHSYHQFGQHFVLIFYGLNQQSQLNRAYIQQHHASILQDLAGNAQLENVEELFLLGFDMSHRTEKDEIDVQIDAYSLPLK